MPLIYLRHPVHGEKVATLELEAEHDEKHGWERYTLGEQPAPEPVNELRPRRRRESSDVDIRR